MAIRTLGALRAGGVIPVIDFQALAASGLLPSGVTLSRASTTTRYNSSSTVESIAIDAPAYDWNPTTLQPLGLRYVPSAKTNNLLQSRALDNASWGKVTATVSANTTVSPDGTQNADTVTLASGAYIYQAISANPGSSPLAGSFYIAAGTRPSVRIWLASSGFSGSAAYIDVTPSTGAISAVTTGGTATAASAKISSLLPSGFYKADITAMMNIASPIYLIAGNDTQSGTVILWQGQGEVASYSAPAIFTAAATVTTAADILGTSAPLTSYLATHTSKLKYMDYQTGAVTTTTFAPGTFAWPSNPAWIQSLTIL